MIDRIHRSTPAVAGLLFVALTGTALLAARPTWDDDDRKSWLEEHATVERRMRVAMRDGVHLSADIYRPKDVEGVLPTIFWRTPYNFDELRGTSLLLVQEAVARGYAVVMQNERGKYFSEGEWVLLGNPRTDGYDSLSWIAEQPWSNGRVGTLGCSSSAEWQLALAAMNHPAHAAMVPMAPGAGIGRVGGFYEQGNWYRGGAEQMFYLPWLYAVQNTQRPRLADDLSQQDLTRLSSYYDLAAEMPDVDWKRKIRQLPLADVMEQIDGPEGIYKEFLARKPDDDAWYAGGLWHDDEAFAVPSLWLFSWFDISTGPNLALVDHIERHATRQEVRDNQFVVMAPVEHCAFFRAESPYTIGERELGNIDFDYEGTIFAWFDQQLKGENNGFSRDTPKVQYWTFGIDRWRTADRWPPDGGTTETFYLAGDGGANSLFGDGRLTTEPPATDRPDRFTYDPTVPVPSLGGGICCIGDTIQPGSFDQREIEARADVLVYTTEPFERALDVTGPVRVTLWVSSDAPDTDFTVKLIDVYPDGTAYNLDETIQRARYREGYDREVFMEPRAVYEITVSPMTTSNVFAAGHRLRIEVSSSNFPRFSRNLNTGGPNYNESVPRTAHNVVHHSKRYPSRIELSVLPRTGS